MGEPVYAGSYPCETLTLTSETPLTVPVDVRRRTRDAYEKRLNRGIVSGELDPDCAASLLAAWDWKNQPQPAVVEGQP